MKRRSNALTGTVFVLVAAAAESAAFPVARDASLRGGAVLPSADII